MTEISADMLKVELAPIMQSLERLLRGQHELHDALADTLLQKGENHAPIRLGTSSTMFPNFGADQSEVPKNSFSGLDSFSADERNQRRGRRVKRLRRVLESAEGAADKKLSRSDSNLNLFDNEIGNNFGSVSVASTSAKRASKFRARFDKLLGYVISINAVFIGVSMDYATEGLSFWSLADGVFVMFFWAELCLGICSEGFWNYFCGSSRVLNGFNVILVSVDTLQAIFEICLGAGKIPSATVLRIFRLLRFARVLQLTRAAAFHDMLRMIQAVVDGLSTLFWLGLLLLVVIYLGALVCREFLGRSSDEVIKPLFSTIPRSMFTVFRCSFGDCTTTSGTPIFALLVEQGSAPMGEMWGLGYMVYMFFVTVCLFNVISALFLERSLTVSAHVEQAQLHARLNNKHLFNTCAGTLLAQIVRDEESGYSSRSSNLSDDADQIADLYVARDVIDRVIREDEVAMNALSWLDIHPSDQKRLAVIADYNQLGAVKPTELLNTLRRIRGVALRSDTISVELVCQGIQERLERIEASLRDKPAANILPRSLSEGDRLFECGHCWEPDFDEEVYSL